MLKFKNKDEAAAWVGFVSASLTTRLKLVTFTEDVGQSVLDDGDCLLLEYRKRTK